MDLWIANEMWTDFRRCHVEIKKLMRLAGKESRVDNTTKDKR